MHLYDLRGISRAQASLGLGLGLQRNGIVMRSRCDVALGVDIKQRVLLMFLTERLDSGELDAWFSPSLMRRYWNHGSTGVKEIMAFDARIIANLMLDEAERCGIRLQNLALQKLLYFAHAIYLIEQKRPLVSGYFEAWKYGPVHPAAYQAFKSAGADDITFRAERVNPVTGVRTPIASPDDPAIRRYIDRVVQSYGRMTARRLVDISHAKGAPWDFIVDKARTSLAFGLRISDDVILERFKHHKVSVGHYPSIGEASEDTPLT